ncbi:VOC family protein [Celeribacter sp.]|uniref:VOC family protein n=1 Tax=Celeribacter sp. TaxID=1890673 RepID=UPI003A8FAD5A
MFSHVTVGADDLDLAADFYDAVLVPLGLKQRVVEPDGGPEARCWVRPEAPYPRFYVYKPFDRTPARAGNGAMLAFVAPTRAAVDTAHAAGLAQGGSDEGAPGLRPQYAPDYYGAYLRDPSGNKVHIVHRAELTESFKILP